MGDEDTSVGMASAAKLAASAEADAAAPVFERSQRAARGGAGSASHSGDAPGVPRRASTGEADAVPPPAAAAAAGVPPRSAARAGAEPGASSAALPKLALACPEFSVMRSGRALIVDKTGAIADLLNCHALGDAHRVFFSRPRKFGKSLTLSTAAEILAAGALPAGVDPWSGYKAVDVDGVFGGLDVYRRVKEAPTELRGLLQEAHFVIKLGLGDVQTGAKLEAGIIFAVASIAAHAFGEHMEDRVLKAPTPGAALRMLVRAVPDAVPVALLVDGEQGWSLGHARRWFTPMRRRCCALAAQPVVWAGSVLSILPPSLRASIVQSTTKPSSRM